MDFLLLENPWETYNPLWALEDEEELGRYRNSLARVSQTGILRVAFSNYPPALIYDSQFDNFSGVFYDIVTRIARKYNWQIRWIEDTGYGVIVEGLMNDRFDVFGSPAWPIPIRREKSNPSASVYSSQAFGWIRESSNLSENNLDDPTVRVAVKENDISEYLANKYYPRMKKVYVPQLDTIPDLLRFVAQDHADITFTEPVVVYEFNENSPIKLMKATNQPTEVFENTFLFKKGDDSIKRIFNAEIKHMKSNNLIQKT